MTRNVVVTVGATALLVVAGGAVAWRLAPAKPTTSEAAIGIYRTGLARLDTALARLDSAVATGDDEAAQRTFRVAPAALKRVELFAEYNGAFLVRELNGVPIPRAEDEDPEAPLPPVGLQVVEGELFPALDKARIAAVRERIGFMRSAVRSLHRAGADTLAGDAFVFDAMRQEIARITTLGLAGFDATITRDGISESAEALEGVRGALTPYRDELNKRSAAMLGALNARLDSAARYLSEHPDFESFDRLHFISVYANPLAHALVDAQRVLGIGPPPKPRAWSARAATPFDRNAFDPRFFAATDAPQPRAELVSLGRALFFDPALSPSGERSCATCHIPERAFTDGRKTAALIAGHAASARPRNTPTLINAALQPALFTDNRVRTLEDQATDVLGSASEMGGSLRAAAEALRRKPGYVERFAHAFGASRDTALSPRTLRLALAAYLRSLTALDSRFDRAARGDSSAMTAEERRGFDVFMGKAMCGTCHFAPLFKPSQPDVQRRQSGSGARERGRCRAPLVFLGASCKRFGGGRHPTAYSPYPMPLPLSLRSLARSRGLSLAVVCTVAVGIGILTTAFGLVDAAVLRPPPFADADRLAVLYTTHASVGQGRHNERWSYPRIQLLRQLTHRFSHVANYTGPAALTLTGGGPERAESVPGEIVSPSYFTTLGVGAAIGRTFLESEDSTRGAHPLVILGHDLWERRYGRDPRIVGRAIGINGTQLTVIGVMPRGFRGLSDKAQLWVPTTMAPVLTYPDYLITDQNFISVAGRLKPDATMAMVSEELRALGPRIYEAIPDTEADSADHAGATAVSLNQARVHPAVRRAVIVLLCGVALLHLLACANVTSLLLGHAIARKREAAVRLALGSGPRRLFLHFFSEGAILVVAGGALGIMLAFWVSALVSAPADMWGPRNFYGSLAPFADPDFSWRTLAFGVALTVVSAILVAWGPAASALSVQLHSGLRDGARGASEHSSPRGRPSARGVIVTLETALAVVLLVAGGLMVDSFNRMRRTDLGVDPAHVLTFTLQPSDARVPPSAAPAFITRMLEAITAVPGVVSATVDGGAPVGGTARSTLFIAGRPPVAPNDAPPVLRHYVAPDHFRTLGIPLLRGRGFTSQDIAGRPRVTIISETAARSFWPNEDPIGQRVWFGGGSSFDRPDSSAEIIGIARDVMYEPLDVGPNRSSFYTPYAQFTYSWRIYFVRTTGDPSAAVGAIREAVSAVEPDLALTEVQTLTERIGASWSRQRFDALFYGGVAVLALVLAVSGIYAVVTYAVGRRTREMGIRLALGSQPGDVVRLVVREGMAAPLAGLVLGTAGTFAAAGLLRASLYGVAPTDARVLASVLTVLLLAALVACLVPARRATKVDPCEALRTE